MYKSDHNIAYATTVSFGDLCKISAWSDHCSSCESNTYVQRNWVVSSYTFGETGPQSSVLIHALYRRGWPYFPRINSSLPGQDGRHFTNYIFKCIFMDEAIIWTNSAPVHWRIYAALG